jgi:hypothetical protein
LVEKPERKRPLGRPRRRWEDNSKVNLGEIEKGDVDSIDQNQDWDKWRTLLNRIMNLRVP